MMNLREKFESDLRRMELTLKELKEELIRTEAPASILIQMSRLQEVFDSEVKGSYDKDAFRDMAIEIGHFIRALERLPDMKN